MNIPQNTPKIESIVDQIDRLISDLSQLRDNVSALRQAGPQPVQSVREAEYFGMWSDREDMQGKTTREWLETLRANQWTRL